jgi:integrase
MPPRSESRIRWLTREEADRLLSGCGTPHIRLFVELGLNTAARSGAILALTWDRVDLNARTIDFRPDGHVQSWKRKTAVPINDRLLSALTKAYLITHEPQPI